MKIVVKGYIIKLNGQLIITSPTLSEHRKNLWMMWNSAWGEQVVESTLVNTV